MNEQERIAKLAVLDLLAQQQPAGGVVAKTIQNVKLDIMRVYSDMPKIEFEGDVGNGKNDSFSINGHMECVTVVCSMDDGQPAKEGQKFSHWLRQINRD